MPALDSLGLPALESVLTGAAGLLNGLYLPAATPATVLGTLAAMPCLVAGAWLYRRLRSGAGQANIIARLEATERQLADAIGEASQLRQRVDQLMARQDAAQAGTGRGSLRQAIALSKHGASARQLVDTCGLSQGEAHLVQTLYGRLPGTDPSVEIH